MRLSGKYNHGVGHPLLPVRHHCEFTLKRAPPHVGTCSDMTLDVAMTNKLTETCTVVDVVCFPGARALVKDVVFVNIETWDGLTIYSTESAISILVTWKLGSGPCYTIMYRMKPL